MKLTRKAVVNDGWENVISGIGTSRDQRTFFSPTTLNQKLPYAVCRALLNKDGIASKCVYKPVKAMLRHGFTIDGDDSEIILPLMNKIFGFDKKLTEALTYDRAYGGAVIYFVVNDGITDQTLPLNYKRIQNLQNMLVYSPERVIPDISSIGKNPASEYFQVPELFNLYHSTGENFKVHRSRLVVLDGFEVDELTRSENMYTFGFSVYDRIYDYVKRFTRAYASADAILDDFVQTVINMEGLLEMIAGGEDDLIRRRAEIIDMTRNTINTIFMDVEEKYQKHSSSVSGLDSVMQEFYVGLSAVADIPVTLLMGRSPAGMNATGDSDFRDFYDGIEYEQKRKLRPILDMLLNIFKTGRLYRIPDAPYQVKFNSLWQMNEAEKAEVEKQKADTYKQYYDMGVITADEIRTKEFSTLGPLPFDTEPEGVDNEEDDKEEV